MAEKYDFSGYATKNDLKCADGRTIRRNAFIDCDNTIVPLVWQHSHGKPGDVLGHALLENREDGVYTYGSFNNTESGRNARELVRHGDVRALSIYANQLVQKGGDVLHGMIREVSLCLAGANPGAKIEDLSVVHFDDDGAEIEAQIYNGNNIELFHSDDYESDDTGDSDDTDDSDYENEEEETEMDGELNVADVIDTMDEDQYNAMLYVVDQALHHSGMSEELDEDATIGEIIDSMNDKQRDALTYVLGQEIAEGDSDDTDDEVK